MTLITRLIKKSLDELAVKDYLNKELERAGVSDISLQKTPIATRISIFVRRPGIVIGKKGKAIKELCDELQQKFGIENPQIEVIEALNPSLDPKLVAERIGKQIELNPRVKPIIRMALKDVMGAGAMGAEIRVAGKIIGKGAKAKALKVRDGYLRKAGDSKKLVKEGHYTTYLKAGAIGILVKIVLPGTIFPDQVPKKAKAVPEVAAEVVAGVEGAGGVAGAAGVEGVQAQELPASKEEVKKEKNEAAGEESKASKAGGSEE